ncbi:MAG: alkaline phosphatase family protein, partial [Deltaproteobacteria bacterium]
MLLRDRVVTMGALWLAACGEPTHVTDGSVDAPADVARDVVMRDRVALPGEDVPDTDATVDGSGDASAPRSNIAHVVVIVQENHTFDAYFGRWCQAPAGSSPTCTLGPACCERAPDVEPAGHAPVVLDDTENAAHDPTHTQPCEREEIHGGAMDRFAAGASCSNPRNFAIVPDSLLTTYRGWAGTYALADRYFQPIVGASSANDMYFAVAQRVFIDNEFKPRSIGSGCTLPAPTMRYAGQTTLADLLIDAGWRFAWYSEGYHAMRDSATCPLPPSDCPFHLPTTPCDYDPSDVPFEYYAQFADNPLYMKDLSDFRADLAAGTLPNVSFIKFLQYHDEHPGYGTRLSDG